MRSVLFITLLLFATGATYPVLRAADEVVLVCHKKQHAANKCHYNFTINGIPFRFEDNGCRFSKEEVIRKAKEGKLALARDWKIDC
jgi:hypothetical protein